MANTISASLITKKLSDAAIETMPGALAPLADFARIIPVEDMAPKRPIEICSVTAAPATQTNATSFEGSADSTYDDIAIQPAQLSQIFHIAPNEYQGGPGLVHLAQSNLQTFSQSILNVALAVMTEANYSTPAVTCTPAAFGQSEEQDLFLAVKSPRRCLLLDSEYYASIIDDLKFNGRRWCLPGFAAVHEISDWSAAGTDIVGCVADPVGLVLAVGLPAQQSNDTLDSRAVTIPELGITIRTSIWCNPNSRIFFGSYDVTLGAGVGKAASLKLVKNG